MVDGMVEKKMQKAMAKKFFQFPTKNGRYIF